MCFGECRDDLPVRVGLDLVLGDCVLGVLCRLFGGWVSTFRRSCCHSITSVTSSCHVLVNSDAVLSLW